MKMKIHTIVIFVLELRLTIIQAVTKKFKITSEVFALK